MLLHNTSQQHPNRRRKPFTDYVRSNFAPSIHGSHPLSTGVGSLWLVQGIPKITNHFDGDIPIIEINEPIKVVAPAEGVVPRPHPPSSVYTRMHAFIMYQMAVELWNLHVFESPCKGPTCKALDTIYASHCGCFSKTEISSTLCLCLELRLKDPNKKQKDINIVNFTSKDFTAFCFKDEYIPKGISSVEFSSNRKRKTTLMKKVDDIIKLVNKDGGWTVVGWLKHGKTRDEAQVQDQSVKTPTHMHSADATHHLTVLKPTKLEEIEGLNALRFDANTLLPNQPDIPAEATARNYTAAQPTAATTENGGNN